jgi:hypothetical protein
VFDIEIEGRDRKQAEAALRQAPTSSSPIPDRELPVELK